MLAEIAAQPQQAPSQPGGDKGPYYLAVGPTKVGIFSTKTGPLSVSPARLLVQHLRSDVKVLQIGGGMIQEVHLVLRDGTYYTFECGQAYLGKVKKIQALLKTE